MTKNIFQRGYRKIVLLVFNNIFANRFWILLGNESWIQRTATNWKRAEYDPSKTLSENVGFSHDPEIEASRNKMQALLMETVQNFLKPGERILEVGCGTGIFLKPLQDKYAVSGIDLSESFLSQAKNEVATGIFSKGNYLQAKFDNPFKLIFFESSLQYFMPSQLRNLFEKLYNDLLPGGIVIIHYSHALSEKDVRFYDLSYIRYSPEFIEKNASEYFRVLQHRHFTDDREVTDFDRYHYFFPGENSHRIDTNMNTYLFMGAKKR